MDYLRTLVVSMLCSAWLVSANCWAAERPYTEGSVWSLTFVRVKPGLNEPYLHDLADHWKKVMEEAHKQQLVVSYKIFSGIPANREDWDLMLLVELKNWAALDGLSAKFETIVEKLIGPETTQTEMMIKRADMREILGTKDVQEITFK